MKKSVVILAAGDFPRKGGTAWRILENADVVVCCDGAADAFRRRFSREPDFAVGDCDSLKGEFANVVRIAEQDTNDLEKAARFCRAKGWRNPVVLGATGKREDHTIGNVFRAMDLGLEIVSDYGRFVPFCGRKTFAVQKGSAISVFAADPAARMSSTGLQWPLDGVVFANPYCATLNRATGEKVVIETDRRACAYIAR